MFVFQAQVDLELKNDIILLNLYVKKKTIFSYKHKKRKKEKEKEKKRNLKQEVEKSLLIKVPLFSFYMKKYIHSIQLKPTEMVVKTYLSVNRHVISSSFVQFLSKDHFLC